MDNYFQVIDGVKYDVGQSTAIAEGMSIEIISCHSNRTIIYSLRKGVNKNYFCHIKTEYTNKEAENDLQILNESIQPLSRNEAIEFYFNGNLNGNLNGLKCRYHINVKMTSLVSEEEAFGEIPLA